jgi:hypothetical protein
MRPDQLRAEQLHEAGEHHQVHVELVQPVSHRLIARGAVGVVRDGEDPSLDPRGTSALEPARLAPARRHAHDLDALTVHGVEQRLEVRPLARDEDGDPERHVRRGRAPAA